VGAGRAGAPAAREDEGDAGPNFGSLPMSYSISEKWLSPGSFFEYIRRPFVGGGWEPQPPLQKNFQQRVTPSLVP
jgi:hypothetical protein